MISKDRASYSIAIPDSDIIVENRLLFFAEKDFVLLKKVSENPDLFVPSIYSILANTFERMYKGFAVELQKIHPEENFLLEDMDNTHEIKPFAKMVNQYCPIATSREAYYVTLDNIDRISKGYTNAKYWDIYELSDFDKDFRRLSLQRERVNKVLAAEIIKNRSADVMSVENDPEINRNDLDLY